MDQHDWIRNDKTLLALLMLAFLAIWCFTRFDKLFDLIGTFQGALIALITGEVLKKRNGNNGINGNNGNNGNGKDSQK